MLFEFDEAKSHSSKAKHGIDSIEAQALWLDEMLIWSAVITYREDRIRLIAVRRSRD